MQPPPAGKDHAVIHSGKGHVPAQSAKGRMLTGFEGTVQVVNLQQQMRNAEQSQINMQATMQPLQGSIISVHAGKRARSGQFASLLSQSTSARACAPSTA